MSLQTIKAAVAGMFPLGTKIKRAKHIEANDLMIESLYYSDWGVPKPFVGAAVPAGYVSCSSIGQTKLVSECHPSFIAALGQTYGGTAGISVGIPYIPAGTSLVQAGTGVYTTFEVGDTGGEEKHTLSYAEMPGHNHLNGIPSNTDTAYLYGSMAYSASPPTYHIFPGQNEVRTVEGFTAYAGGLSVSPTSPGTASPHNNMPPYFAVNYILRYI